MAKRVAREEGLLVGISSGANLQASFEVASREGEPGKVIVTILWDTEKGYMSTDYLIKGKIWNISGKRGSWYIWELGW